ncbi:MAG: glyoxalase/bleomycin resistance/extradiol dioxygenase family protein [Bacteroidetes bacterium]|nr:MAG: glyoxalase/bleomycin resistance/extradiol dioxygenase family protein [Bacteroidota bacterium]
MLSILETCLYAEDLEAAEDFYTRVLGLELFAREPGRHVFFRCGSGMFLIFNPAATQNPASSAGGVVPGHGARGPGHVCFRIAAGETDRWREKLLAEGVAIESEVHWPRGGTSLYFRDPAGNCVELAPASIWGLKETP